jgi:hypothetical protein
MVLRRVAFKPLCRQCGHKFERPVARCPLCGLRTGYVEPLQSPLRPAIDSRRGEVVADSDLANFDLTISDLDDEADDMVLAPPVERSAAAAASVELYRPPEDDIELDIDRDNEPAPIARRISIGGLIVGTGMVAVCLGIARASLAAGIIAFLVLIPAFVRTLSGISYFRDRGRHLSREEVGAMFAVSFVLSVMGLAPAGLVFLATTFVSGLVVGFLPAEQQLIATTLLGTTAAFITVFVLIHRVWPVNED